MANGMNRRAMNQMRRAAKMSQKDMGGKMNDDSGNGDSTFRLTQGHGSAAWSRNPGTPTSHQFG